MFCSQRPCCLTETLNFTTECVAELLAKSANAKVHFFSTVNEGENAQSKKNEKTWWVRVQYQGLCHPTALWNERVHSWSESLLAPCPPWATMKRLLGGMDMVWKLCDKEECPKLKWFVKLLFVLCENGPIRWKTTKNFGWVSIRVSTELCIGLCWMN